MLWTVALIATGCAGMFLIARHWQGWVLYLINEVLWFAYAIKTHDTALVVMAVIWFALGVRNLSVAWRRDHGRFY